MKQFELIETPIHGALILQQKPVPDDRGFFSKIYSHEQFQEQLPHFHIQQINHSLTEKIGTIRGLHYQIAPHTESKLVKCFKGRIFDVIVDCRTDSPTFLKWFGTFLDPKSQQMLWVPQGCAHGFQAQEENTEVVYFSSAPYRPESERGIRYDDPRIGIDWPTKTFKLSVRDLDILHVNSDFRGFPV